MELGDKKGMGDSLNNLGVIYDIMENYKKALEFHKRSLNICEELDDKWGICKSLNYIGTTYLFQFNYEYAIKYLENAYSLQKKIGLEADELIETATTLYLTYKRVGKGYKKKTIQTLIKKTPHIDFRTGIRLYQLLEDRSYLETAYNQVQELADNLEPDVAAKFLSYPIPKEIVEEWEKVK